MNTPKRHHYLPISYLTGFTDNDILWVFDKENAAFRNQTPINTGLKKHLNTFTDEIGKKQTIESELSEIEGAAKKVILKLDHKKLIKETERESLSLFVSLLWNRVPVYSKDIAELGDRLHKDFLKKVFDSEEHAQEIIDKFPKRKGSNITARDIVDFVQNEEFNVVPNANDIVTTRIPIATNLSKKLLELDWLFIYSPKKEPFITTDNPYTLVSPSEIQLKKIVKEKSNVDLSIVVPLSRRTCLIINSSGMSGTISISKHDARQINTAIIKNFDRFVISSDLDYLKHLVKISEIDKCKGDDRFKPIDFMKK